MISDRWVKGAIRSSSSSSSSFSLRGDVEPPYQKLTPKNYTLHLGCGPRNRICLSTDQKVESQSHSGLTQEAPLYDLEIVYDLEIRSHHLLELPDTHASVSKERSKYVCNRLTPPAVD